MGAPTPADKTASVIRDLLRIARVAMPPDLIKQDIRIRNALDLLAELDGTGSSVRVPDHPAKYVLSHAERLAELRPVEHGGDKLSFVTDLDWDLVLAVTEAQHSILPLDPSAAINQIVRDWCISSGFMPTPPEDSN